MNEGYYQTKDNVFFRSEEEVKMYFHLKFPRTNFLNDQNFIDYIESKISTVEALTLSDEEKEELVCNYENNLYDEWFSNEIIKCYNYEPQVTN